MKTTERLGHYRVLYADPPWSYGDRGMSGSKKPSGAASHYSTMTLDDIKALPVSLVTADDALCFMWATGPQLPAGLEVMAAWGFEFKTIAFTWVKTGTRDRSKAAAREALRRGGVHDAERMTALLGWLSPVLLPTFHFGQGSYSRSNAEFVLLGKRGAGAPRVCASVRSEVLAKRRGHSEKPEEVAKRIEQLVGDVPRLELFARRHRPGWDVWGDEVVSDLRIGGDR